MGGRPKLAVLGKRFGRLTVLERDGNIQPFAAYKCQCNCGNIIRTSSVKLANGHTKSCGCLPTEVLLKRSTTHGMSSHVLYGTWKSMLRRCQDPKSISWKYYGDRGIKVCTRWENVNNFVEDMYPTYKKGLTLDRIDNDGNYEANNCRWATRTAQNKNRSIGIKEQSKICPRQWTRIEPWLSWSVGRGSPRRLSAFTMP